VSLGSIHAAIVGDLPALTRATPISPVLTNATLNPHTFQNGGKGIARIAGHCTLAALRFTPAAAQSPMPAQKDEFRRHPINLSMGEEGLP
jgi:hypothetical protein